MEDHYLIPWVVHLIAIQPIQRLLVNLLLSISFATDPLIPLIFKETVKPYGFGHMIKPRGTMKKYKNSVIKHSKDVYVNIWENNRHDGKIATYRDMVINHELNLKLYLSVAEHRELFQPWLICCLCCILNFNIQAWLYTCCNTCSQQ